MDDIRRSIPDDGAKPLHVLHVTEPFSFGCLTAISSIIAATASDAMRHTVVHGTERTSSGAEAYFPQETRFIPLQSLSREIVPVRDLGCLRELRELVQRVRPDVIHCHSSKAGVLGRLAGWLGGIPSLYTPHGFSFLQTNASALKRALFHGIEWGMARLGGAVVACGRQEYDIARTLCPHPERVFFVPNSLNTSLLDSARAETVVPPDGGRVRAGVCGRVTFARNTAWVVQAASAMRESVDWTWIGGGEGAESLPEWMRCTPRLDYRSALREMNALDIYVQPSRWEGLSFSILEAMYLGKPVVATRIPANEAVIQHGVTGLLADTSEELTAYVRRLAGDADLRARIGSAAHEYAAREHDSCKIYRRYADIYACLAGSGG